MTYFHEREAHYHWRRYVSRSCSGWEGVGPYRYGRQTKRFVTQHASAKPSRTTDEFGLSLSIQKK